MRIVCTRVRFDMVFFVCEEVPATIIAIFAQCGLVAHTHTPITMTLAGRLFRNLG